MKRIYTLDGIRGYAVLMIMLAHLPVLEKGLGAFFFNSVPLLLKFSYLGVDIFFVLSGFLISRILLKEKEMGEMSFRRFYVRRALRIFPAYYVCIILCGLLVSWNNLVPVIFYYNNYFSAFHNENEVLAHSWTLAVEEHFYLVWPLLIYVLSRRSAKRVIFFLLPGFAVLSGIIMFFFLRENVAAELLYKSTDTRILSLAAGSCLAFAEPVLKNLRAGHRFILLGSGIILYLLCIFIASPHDRTLYAWSNYLLLTPLSCIVVMLAISLEDTKTIFAGLLNNRVITYIGRISYGMYLYHLPVYYFSRTMPGKDVGVAPGNAIVAIAGTILVASISYWLFERRFLKLKDRLSNHYCKQKAT